MKIDEKKHKNCRSRGHAYLTGFWGGKNVAHMSSRKAFKLKKEMAFEAYLLGKTDPRELAELVGASPVTVRKWIRAGAWDQMESELRKLNQQIFVWRKQALLTALRNYANDPKNTALQSLVSILKEEARRDEPARELCDYIVKFLDQVTDFMLERGLDGLLKQYQPHVMDLAEYLRKRNG